MVPNRMLPYENGKIFLATLDNQLVMLGSMTGKVQWATRTGEINLGETTIINAPLVVKGKVFAGLSGGKMGVSARVTALDENTGQDRLLRLPDRSGPGRTPWLELQAPLDFMKGRDLGQHLACALLPRPSRESGLNGVSK